MKWLRLARAARPGRLAVHLLALWKLMRHPDTPRAAKWLAVLVLAYALSPIDLIPDFIPFFGQLDDLVLVPLGIALVARLVPKALWQARLAEAEASREKLPRVWWGIVLVVVVWALVAAAAAWLLLRDVASP
jgi:uncharacterized membrane protein YkvA (DUF1232 family)